MNMRKIEERALELRNQIQYHNDRYYNLDDPIISDYEFDKLMNELKELEKEYPALITPDSPTQKVGGSVKRQSGKLVKHRVPMLSLQDLFTKDEVYRFVEDTQKQLENPEFVVERKIDGLSMALRYKKGTLETALTRGDGIIEGEDVTENALVINDVMKNLRTNIPYLEVRGEVYMSRKTFEAVNERRELLGEKLFANPRNCAAGTLRQLDPQITKQRELSLFIFNIQEIKGVDIKTHTDGYEFLKSQGIKVIEEYKICKTADEVWKAIQEIGSNRGDFAYEIDGAVIKINNLKDREVLGSTSKTPRWAVAYKYPPEEKETIVKDIRLTVGRTGRITPTAIFEPIYLCGTTVEKATLHNQDRISDLDVRIDDCVVVRKAGEIIPEIVRVVKEKRPSDTVPYVIPNACPVCGAPALREKDTADIKCTGVNCPAQLEQHIINFVGKKSMDIKGFGDVYIETLVQNGYIKDVADIYNLNQFRNELIEKGYIGKEKNTDKLLDLIEQSKLRGPQFVLAGLGIPNIGSTASKSLIAHFGSIDKIMTASLDDLTNIKDIGTISAAYIKDYFDNPANVDLIKRLKSHNVVMEVQEEDEKGTKSDILSGQTFVVTGTLTSMSRDDIENLIEQNGGKASGSVSKKTNYVLAGENAGSKLKKAVDLAVPVITEEEFLKLLTV